MSWLQKADQWMIIWYPFYLMYCCRFFIKTFANLPNEFSFRIYLTRIMPSTSLVHLNKIKKHFTTFHWIFYSIFCDNMVLVSFGRFQGCQLIRNSITSVQNFNVCVMSLTTFFRTESETVNEKQHHIKQTYVQLSFNQQEYHCLDIILRRPFFLCFSAIGLSTKRVFTVLYVPPWRFMCDL